MTGLFTGDMRFKAALHVHSTNSDGVNPLYSVIEEHYRKGYDVLAITDHNVLTRSWVSANRSITPERFDEIAAGVGRDGRKMLQIPDTNEIGQAWHDDIHSSFSDFMPTQWFSDGLSRTLQQIQNRNGLSHLNHLGRYTGGQSDRNQSDNPVHINKYVNLFMTFSTCVGMEIINRKDGESRNDRFLWDNINAATIPQGLHIWGFANDDTHSNIDTGFAFNVLVMPENTLEQFANAMQFGSWYAVSTVAHNENVNNVNLLIPTPIIKSITQDGDRFTIVAENYNTIDWITEGTRTIATGETIKLGEVAGPVGAFVRANVIGSGGIAFTQPFGTAL